MQVDMQGDGLEVSSQKYPKPNIAQQHPSTSLSQADPGVDDRCRKMGTGVITLDRIRTAITGVITP